MEPNGDVPIHDAEIEPSGASPDPEREGFAVEAGFTPSERWIRAVTPVVVAAAILALTALPLRSLPKWFPMKSNDSSFIPGWVKWNYEGYERKPSYPEYKDVIATMARVGKEHGCGRSSWEYESELDRFGTPMALMLLPYWTHGCIGSMEGLYFESSATTPYHFLSNSELSLRPPRPQRDLPYRELDVRLGVQHLQMMGVRYYIALSDAAKAQARVNPDLTLIDHTGVHSATVTESGKPAELKTRDWEIYEVAHSATVAPLTFEPVVMQGVPKGGPAWQKAAVDWFQGDAARWEVPLAASGPKEWRRVQGPVADPPRRAVAPAAVTNIKMEDDRITLRCGPRRSARLGEDVVLPELEGVRSARPVARDAERHGRDPDVAPRHAALRLHAR